MCGSSPKVRNLRNLFIITPFLFAALITVSVQPGHAQGLVSADLDGNGKINAVDMFLFTALWKTQGSAADLNGDGTIDAVDMMLFTSSFHEFIEPTPTPTLEEATPTETATPTIAEATPTPTATLEVETPTPTATPTIADATPTPTATLTEDTPTPAATPTIAEATPTPTPTLEIVEETPTPTETPIVIEFTPTPTLGEVNPTPTLEEATPTPIVEAPTATPVEETPTPTFTPPHTPTPTPTPTVDVNATPTPTQQGLFFSTNFDTAVSFDAIGLTTLQSGAEDQLIADNRMPETNTLVPWFILNTEDLDPDFDYGVALSDPKSAALNANHFSYTGGQTSILEIKNTPNTSQAGDPVLSFDAAFLFEIPMADDLIRDYMVVEVKRSNSSAWEILDINGDGKVIEDRTAYDGANPQSLLKDTFDGLFGASNSQHQESPLVKADFVPVEIHLPSDSALKIAFRFESDSSVNGEGVYLDNIRVYDASTAPTVPVIRQLVNQDGTDLYVDTENRITIQGVRLTSAQKVIFQSRDGETNLTFTETADGLSTVLPRLSNPTQAETAALKVIGKDGAESAPYSVVLKAAPAPEIDSISPSPFFLGASDSAIHIYGKNFRPAFTGATDSGGTVVLIDTGAENPIRYAAASDFASRSLTEITIDGAPLKSLSSGTVTITVLNEYSGLESISKDLLLQSGAGELQVNGFTIELGQGAYSYDPAVEQYTLQQDQSFTLSWDVQGIVSDQLNIDLAGIPFVVNGAINATVIRDRLNALGRKSESIDGKASVYAGYYGVTLDLAPMILGATGTITASIRLGNGAPVDKTFALYGAQPPLLYERSGDWASQSWSTAKAISFSVFGDNFRGLYTFSAEGESVTRLQLIPVDGGDPINLPKMDQYSISINPQIGDPDHADELAQIIPTNFYNSEDGQRLLVPTGETKVFKLRAINPDSGLFVDSAARTVTFTP